MPLGRGPTGSGRILGPTAAIAPLTRPAQLGSAIAKTVTGMVTAAGSVSQYNACERPTALNLDRGVHCPPWQSAHLIQLKELLPGFRIRNADHGGKILKSVLIVEDEIFIAMEIERILEEAGYRVIAIAADRQEALEAGDHADLAFVDLNLRDGPTGADIALELASKHGVRVVYVTANPAQIGEPAASAIGCIRKPFTDHVILSAAAIAAGTSPKSASQGLFINL